MEQEGVVGVCVADELGLCVTTAGNVSSASSGIVTDLARTSKLFFPEQQAPNTVIFVETDRTYVPMLFFFCWFVLKVTLLFVQENDHH